MILNAFVETFCGTRGPISIGCITLHGTSCANLREMVGLVFMLPNFGLTPFMRVSTGISSTTQLHSSVKESKLNTMMTFETGLHDMGIPKSGKSLGMGDRQLPTLYIGRLPMGAKLMHYNIVGLPIR